MWLISFFTNSSLCNYLRESNTDLRLVPVDDETERIIWKKDEEVKQLFIHVHLLSMVDVTRGETIR